MAKVKLVGILSRYAGGQAEVEVKGGRSVEETLKGLGIPSSLAGIVLVNGRQVDKSYVIEGGDGVNLTPLLGGG